MNNNHLGRFYPKYQIPIQPNIGLDDNTRQSVVEILNTILADETVLTMKTRSAHWHICGPNLLDLQTLFDQQVIKLNELSDEIAERIRMLGGFAISSLEENLAFTRLKEQPGIVPDIMDLLADQEACIRFMREDSRKCSEEYEDHTTFALLVRFIGLHEKMAWILRSYIEPESTRNENLENKVQSNQS